MDKTDRDKIIKKIKACLELSRDGSFKTEADAALGMAKKLMAKHDLSSSDIDLFNSPDNIINELTLDDINIRNNWDYSFAASVALLCNVRAVRGRKKNSGTDFKWRNNISFIGYKDDIFLAKDIYLLLRVTSIMMATNYTKGRKRRELGIFRRLGVSVDIKFPTKKIKRSYLLGLAGTFSKRSIVEVELPKEERVLYGALVVAKEKNISTWINKNKKIKGSHQPKVNKDVDRDAYWEGKEDGEGIPLKNKREIKSE